MLGKLYKNVFKLAIILFALLLLCCKEDLHSAEKSKKTDSCQMSEKCLVLLAYGVLSNDELDIPFGGSCKDIASDSLVNFLKSQKAVFNDSKNDSINAKELIRQIEEKSKKSNECKMSDCITLISYGLLSEKEIDIPFDGVCKGIVSDSITDSLSKYLNNEKNIFRRWQLDRTFDEKENENNDWFNISGKRAGSEDWKYIYINWLGTLIRARIQIGPKKIVNPIEREDYDDVCNFNYSTLIASDLKNRAGDDVSFGWRLKLLGDTYYYISCKVDSLVRISNFTEYAIYLDSLFNRNERINGWCFVTEDAAKNLSKHSKDDFLLKYHYSRCQFKDDRDGKFYRIFKMPGGKIWLTENLNYRTESSWCYNDDDSNCEKYGRLYNWESALKACPNGWHLPTDDDWQAFIDSVERIRIYFSFQLGGMRIDEKKHFVFADEMSFWWTATEYKRTYSKAYSVIEFHGNKTFIITDMNKSYGFSVRCVRDE